ncbi:S8 family serine peptidase [Planctomycetota bacterium]
MFTRLSAIITISIAVVVNADSFDERYLEKIDPSLHSLVVQNYAHSTNALELSAQQTLPDKDVDEEWFRVTICTKKPEELILKGFRINSVLPNFVTAHVKAKHLLPLALLDTVSYIDADQTSYPCNDIAAAWAGADSVKRGLLNNTKYQGAGVLVCIIDSGIDWTHKDFRNPVDPSQSRILYIWDQTDEGNGGGSPQDHDPDNFTGLDYGVEYTIADIEDELDGSPRAYVRERDTNGHGTHVAGTVAGNGAALSSRKYAGMAPKADIVVVKAGNGSYDDTFLIDAMTYARQISLVLERPIVVNMSLGGHMHAHDGTTYVDQAVDDFVGEGRVLVAAAGNEGDNAIHISGSVAKGDVSTIAFNVAPYDPESGKKNDVWAFDLWFDTDGEVSATVISPSKKQVTINADSYMEKETQDGFIVLNNSSDFFNGDREVIVQISDKHEYYPPSSGDWFLHITNHSAATMTYHGWLYYDTNTTMRVTLREGDTDYTIGSPGTATEAITVGSYVGRWHWSNDTEETLWGGNADSSDDISPFSSLGPRRDRIQKPDITASGQWVGSSTSQDSNPSDLFVLPGGKHHLSPGTSMASPVVAGAVALLLEANPSLTARQVKTLIQNNADTDGYTGSVPNVTWGYGRLNIVQTMQEPLALKPEVNHEILSYDGWGNNYVPDVTPEYRAVRFTPTVTGPVVGALFHVGYISIVNVDNNPAVGNSMRFQIWTNGTTGLPRIRLGSTVLLDQAHILPNSWNAVDLSGCNVTVNKGTEYHLVAYQFGSGRIWPLFAEDESLDNRSSYNRKDGKGWKPCDYDYRMRPIIVGK